MSEQQPPSVPVEAVSVELYRLQDYEEDPFGVDFAVDINDAAQQIVGIAIQDNRHGLPRLENNIPYVTPQDTTVFRRSSGFRGRISSETAREIVDHVEFQELEKLGSPFGTLRITQYSSELRGGKNMERGVFVDSMSIMLYRPGKTQPEVVFHFSDEGFEATLEVVAEDDEREFYTLLRDDEDGRLPKKKFEDVKEEHPELIAHMTTAIKTAQQLIIQPHEYGASDESLIHARAALLFNRDPHTKRPGVLAKLIDQIVEYRQK